MKNFILLLAFSIINFISWNFFGLLFILNCTIIFYYLEILKVRKWQYAFKIGFLLFFLFNISASFWLIKVDEIYGCYALLFNSFLMLIVFLVTIIIFKNKKHYKLIFIFSWVIMEWLFSKWDLAWPWFNFGNVLANQWYLIKWYAIVGTYGGSFWLLFVGLIILNIIQKKQTNKNIMFITILFTLPIYSIFDYHFAYELSNKKTNILTFIPKSSNSNYSRTKKLFKYINSHNAPNIILTSELFYSNIHPSQINNGDISFYLKKIFHKNQNTIFIVGTEIENSPSIKFNGISVITKDSVYFRTKKKYVPVTEFTTKILTPLFGNSFYSKNNNDDVTKITNNYKIFPYVCYESVFPSFFAENSINTKFVFLSTSEAFLNKSDYAKKQYLNIIRIRAIENGR